MIKNIRFMLTLVFGLTCFVMTGQVDTTKQKAVKIDPDVKVLKRSEALKAKGANNKVKTLPQLNLKPNAKLNKEAVDKRLTGTKPKDSHFLMETLPEDRDIMGKKYWKGKDVTHMKLESNYSLGTVKTSSNTVRVECRDYSLVDGDRIRIFHNETAIRENIGLKGNYHVVYITLKKGYNRIDFQALNQGYSGPNTAELLLFDHLGNLISSKEWSLATHQVATLGVIKY
jgi:hypothetical protein